MSVRMTSEYGEIFEWKLMKGNEKDNENVLRKCVRRYFETPFINIWKPASLWH